MMTQQRDNVIQPEEQVQPSIEEGNTLPSAQNGSKKATSKGTMLSIGTFVFFLGGILYPSLSSAGVTDTLTEVWVWSCIGSVLVLIGAVVCGLMARSYGTPLALPAVITMGLLVGGMFISNDLSDLLVAWAFHFSLLVFPLTTFVGAAIGTLLGKEWKERKTK